MREKREWITPQNLPFGVLWSVLWLARLFSHVPRRMRERHRVENEDKWRELAPLACGTDSLYIEHQNQLSRISYGRQRNGWSRLFLGGRPINGMENSCEVSALYNALVFLGSDGRIGEGVSFPALLSHFERKGILLDGYLGTFPDDIIRYLRDNGYQVLSLKGRQITESRLKQLERESAGGSAYILTTFNNAKSLFGMLHTMCITREKEGFVMHNDYEGTKCYPSLAAACFGYHHSAGKPVMVLKITNTIGEEKDGKRIADGLE